MNQIHYLVYTTNEQSSKFLKYFIEFDTGNLKYKQQFKLWCVEWLEHTQVVLNYKCGLVYVLPEISVSARFLL